VEAKRVTPSRYTEVSEIKLTHDEGQSRSLDNLTGEHHRDHYQ
jgi:hypothetical protein